LLDILFLKVKVQPLERPKTGNVVHARATEQMSLKKNTFVFLGGWGVSIML